MKLKSTLLILVNFFMFSAFSQDVLVIWDDSPTNPNTVSLVNALTGVGFNVTLSDVSETAWNNTNPSLTGFEAVIHINGTTFATGMPAAGQSALVDYVENNYGKYVGFEWNAYEVDENLSMTAMADLTLFVRNNAGGTFNRTLDVVPAQAGHPVMAGVSAQFDIVGCLEIGGIRAFGTQPSTVLMTHQGYDAVAIRDFGNGQVLGCAFAPNWDINSTCLTSPDVQLMIINFIGLCAPTTGTDVVSACDSYTWNTNGQTYTQSGQYTEVLTNQVGCDSTVTLNLTITNSNTGSETVTECDSYTWNTNGQTYTQSGQYTEVLTNQVGCDSTVTLNLTITNSNTGFETVTECDSYTWNTNGQTYTQSGQYTEVLTNQDGCDSTVTLNLTITNSNTGFETVTECDSYTWNANGQTYTQSGQYTELLTNQSGCDSTVTLNLTIEFVDITSQPVDQTVVVGNNGQFTVTTSATNPTYQWQMNDGTGWIDLFNAGQYSGTDTDVLTISNVQFGQNNFLYRCIVTSGNCETTSSVGKLTIQDNVGLDDINKNIFNVYPNPTSNSFTISSEKVINSEFKIIDSQGREVLTGSMNGQEHTIDISKLSKGVYSVVFNNTKYPMISVIKE